jgi:hypothetical protein
MGYSHHDETFFVESDGGAPESRLAHTQHVARMMARTRQDQIADELTRLASDEYLEDILEHLKQMEMETLPDVNLIDMQREIQWFMRPYLIDFLVEAHAAFSLLPETLFLAVNLLDRYCARRVVNKQHYQLVGCAALLIAAKYGDKKDRVPQINELSNMCCGLYDAGMFTQMEMHVLNTLEWAIGHPTVDFFLKLMVAEQQDCQEVEHMASYLCEMALYHRDFVSTKPSVMARASLALARGMQDVDEYERDLSYAERTTMRVLAEHLHDPSPTLARKYSTPHFSRVSQRLADFLATPPEPSPPQPEVFSTPQRGHGATLGFDGYLTPPITPDGACFGNMPKDGYPLPRCPVTPSPHTGPINAYTQHHPQQQYHGHPSYPGMHQQ